MYLLLLLFYVKGGKQGNNPPPISAVFKRTRGGKQGKLNEDDAAKYVCHCLVI